MPKANNSYIPLVADDSEDIEVIQQEPSTAKDSSPVIQDLPEGTLLIDPDTIDTWDTEGSVAPPVSTDDLCAATQVNLLNTSHKIMYSINLTREKDCYLFGRSKQSCDHAIDDPRCSRQHFEIRLDADDSIIIKDRKSSNGTFVNDEKVTLRELRLNDRIRAGRSEFIVEINC